MRPLPFRPSTDGIPSCRSRRAGPNATASNTNATGRSPCLPPVATGDVEGMTAARHTSAQFLRVLDRVIATQSARRAIHLIADNLSAQTTTAVAEWLVAHPRVTLHDTPTYRSWLNHVELWFATIERDMIARGICTSVADLRRTLM